MFCVNDCTQRFLKTYFKIIQSGLFNKVEQINVILVGPQDNSSIKTQLQRLNKVKFFEKLNSGSEVETLNAIWQYSQVYDGYVLYLHGKGVTRPDNSFINDWKECMEYFMIEKHENCLQLLNDFDVVGPNIRDTPMRHFSGNFWWAKTSHLRNLNKLDTLETNRLYCEFWLFDCSKPFTYKCIYDSKVNHYGESFGRENYINTDVNTKIPTPSKWKHNVLTEVSSAWKGLEDYVEPIIETYNITPNLMLEFGVDNGYSSYIFSKVFKKVIGVDHFMGDEFIRHSQGDDFYKTIVERFKDSNVELVRKGYQEFVIGETRQFDLIHVDINHTYEDTFACLDWSVQHSKVVIAHDTDSFPAVKRAVLDIAAKHNINFYNINKFYGLGILYKS